MWRFSAEYSILAAHRLVLNLPRNSALRSLAVGGCSSSTGGRRLGGLSESCASTFRNEEGVAEGLGELLGEVSDLDIRGGGYGEYFPGPFVEPFCEAELYGLHAVGDPGEGAVTGAVLDEVAALAEGAGPGE
jgi:hypothetical protein